VCTLALISFGLLGIAITLADSLALYSFVRSIGWVVSGVAAAGSVSLGHESHTGRG
jgi:hypothetical protein